jgi:hypothetical protein
MWRSKWLPWLPQAERSWWGPPVEWWGYLIQRLALSSMPSTGTRTKFELSWSCPKRWSLVSALRSPSRRKRKTPPTQVEWPHPQQEVRIRRLCMAKLVKFWLSYNQCPGINQNFPERCLYFHIWIIDSGSTIQNRKQSWLLVSGMGGEGTMSMNRQELKDWGFLRTLCYREVLGQTAMARTVCGASMETILFYWLGKAEKSCFIIMFLKIHCV